MKLRAPKIGIATAAALVGFGVGPLSGQNAGTPATQEEAVKLDPFNVSADSDVGFVAASSLAGGRIATALKDTPVAYSVLTKEFLDAFNINDISEAANFSVNSNYSVGDNNAQGFANGPAQNVQIRGQAANIPTRNFFPYNNTADSFDIDRVDQARGSNAVLFGAGGAGGTQNTATKQAIGARSITEVQASVGSFSRYRFTADINRPINDKLALRTNLMWSTGDTWRPHEWEDKAGFHLAATYKFNPKFSIRGEFEYRTDRRLSAAGIQQDSISAWDGKFISTGINNALTATQLATSGVARAPLRFVTRPDYDGIVYNFQNLFRTKGAGYNATNTNYLNGQPIKSVGFNLSGNSLIDVWDTPERFAASLAGAPAWHVPNRAESPAWDSPDHSLPTYRETARDAALYFTYTPFEGVFTEIAVDGNNSPRIGNNSDRRGQQATMIDLDRMLPDEVTPNPHFLQGYDDYLIYEYQQEETFENLRFQFAYVKDTRFGKLQFGTMIGKQIQKTKARTLTILMPATWLGPDFRTWVDSSQDLNVYGDYTRIYADDKLRNFGYPTNRPVTVVDPVNGIRQIVTPGEAFFTTRLDNNLNAIRTYRFAQAGANFSLFKDHLVLIGFGRRDLTYINKFNFLLPADNAPGWNGQTLTLLPPPPADFWSLTYYPKDASGKIIGPLTPADSRPRIVVNNVNMRAPQYANDRFRDDYDQPASTGGKNTVTYGTVVNVTKGLGIYANHSTTFNLIITAQDLFGQLIPPTASQGEDAGIRYTMPNQRLSASLGWYKAYQAGQAFKIGTGLGGVVGNFAALPIVGDLTTTGKNIRGLNPFPTNVDSTQTSSTKGYELEVTANLTPSWRLILNASTVDTDVRDQYPDAIRYINANIPLFKQILTDGGIQIDANNQASIIPALNDPTKINVTAADNAVTSWNSLYSTVIPQIVGLQGTVTKANGSIPYSGNLATDYRFRTGRLDGLRVGLGINYRGGQILGNTASNTIPNPNNPTVAIPDPNGSVSKYVYGPSFYKGTGTLSYTVKLNDQRRYVPKSIQFNLTIDNFFGLGHPLYGSSGTTSTALSGPTILAPLNNDISSPAVHAIPGNPTYLPPRNYTLSARMEF